MRRRRTLVLLLPLVAVVASCGIPADSEPQVIPDNRVLFDLLTPSTIEPATTTPVATAPATIFLYNADHLVAAQRTVAAPSSVGTVLANLVQGPTSSEIGVGLSSAVDPQTQILNAQITNGVAQINVDDAFSGLGVQAQIRALAQIVFTATSVEGVGSVQVSLNGVLGDVPKGDGTLTTEPLRRSDYAGLAPR